MERVILQGSNKPSPQEGQNGNYYVQVKDTKIVLWGPKQNGHWPLGFEVDMPKGEKGEPGKDGRDGRDGMDGFTRVIAGDNVIVKGSGTVKDPYTINVKENETIQSFNFSESKGKITLITNLGNEFEVSLQELIRKISENRFEIENILNRNNKYYLSDTVVPIGSTLSKRGGGRDGVSTGRYIIVPHTSLLTEITWNYLAAGPKQHTVDKVFRPHQELGGKRPLVTIDVYCENSCLGRGINPKKSYQFDSPQVIEGGSIIYFDVNVAKGDPHGMTVTLGFTSTPNDDEFINI